MYFKYYRDVYIIGRKQHKRFAENEKQGTNGMGHGGGCGGGMGSGGSKIIIASIASV